MEIYRDIITINRFFVLTLQASYLNKDKLWNKH